MKILLCAINSKYIHTSPGIFSIRNSLEKISEVNVEILELFVNQSLISMIDEIVIRRPDVIGFSSYIWNQEIIFNLTELVKQIFPETCIVLGGPEAGEDPLKVFEKSHSVDYIVQGSGERSFADLMKNLMGPTSHAVKGVWARDPDNRFSERGRAELIIPELSFQQKDFENLQNRMIYYESSRGCPYNCSFCVSSSFKGMVFRSLKQVRDDLLFLDSVNPKVIKWVDRTFNFDQERTKEILNLVKELNLSSVQHFELYPNLINEGLVHQINELPENKVQFEIGIQATQKEILKRIGRPPLQENSLKCISDIIQTGKFHVHLDILAGLPGQCFEDFLESLEILCQLKPHHLQMGFLKVLPGTRLSFEIKEENWVVETAAPYTVLKTPWMSYEELKLIRDLEEIYEYYFNTHRFDLCLKYLVRNTFVDFLLNFQKFLSQRNFFQEKKKDEKKILLLMDFSSEILSKESEIEFFVEMLYLDLKMRSRFVSGDIVKQMNRGDFPLMEKKIREIKKELPESSSYQDVFYLKRNPCSESSFSGVIIHSILRGDSSVDGRGEYRIIEEICI